jgi:Protein of unknown function (DUF732)
MKRRNLAGAFIATAAAVLLAAGPAAADPTVQQLQPSLPSTPQRDDAFLADLARAGMSIADVPTAIAGARDTCAYLASGHTAMQAVEQGLKNNATMTRADEIAYVDAAIDVYCPRYLGLTGTLA